MLSSLPTDPLYVYCGWEVTATRVMRTMRSGPQGPSKSESHLASLKGDGSPTPSCTFSRGWSAVEKSGPTDSSRNDLCAPGGVGGPFSIRGIR